MSIDNNELDKEVDNEIVDSDSAHDDVFSDIMNPNESGEAREKAAFLKGASEANNLDKETVDVEPETDVQPEDAQASAVEASNEIDEEVKDQEATEPVERLWEAKSSSLAAAYGITDEDVPKIPSKVQEVLRDVETFIAEKVPILQSVEHSLEGYTPILESLGVDAPTFIGNIVSYDRTFRFGSLAEKQAAMEQLWKEYKLDGVGMQAGKFEVTDKDLHDASSAILRLQTQLKEAQTTLGRERFDKFATNKEYAKDPEVVRTMFSFIKSGRAQDMDAAYDMAIWAVPHIRDLLIKQKEAQEKKTIAKKPQSVTKKIDKTYSEDSSASAYGSDLADDFRADLERHRSRIVRD